jgi:hypothetical protein
MNNATMTEIKAAPYWAMLPEFRTEINLDRVLLKELTQELASDINSAL